MFKEKYVQEYADLYNSGMRIMDIADKYNITYKIAYERITGSRFDRRYIEDLEKQTIKNMYLSGISTVAIGKRYGVTYTAIINALHDAGIQCDQGRIVRKYALDISYFDSIDNQDKAYIFGFLLADGTVNLSKGTISISLPEEDKYILDAMKNKFNYSKELEFIDNSKREINGYKLKNMYKLSVFSSHMCEVLIGMGMVENKSYYLKFVDLPDEYMSHMIRGYFDGNGTLGIPKNTRNGRQNAFVSIVSTYDFCCGLQKYLMNKLGIKSGIYESQNKNNITHDFSINNRKDQLLFLNWIYYGANMYLTRKYEKYQKILEYYN